jgi:DNA-directed RNA polymerase subunit beta'
VEELFEARKAPKGEAVVSEIAGKAEVVQSDKYSDMRVVHVRNSEMVSDTYEIGKGWKVKVKDEDEVKEGELLAEHEDGTLTAEHGGRVRIEKGNVIVSYEIAEESEYEIPPNTRLIVSTGDDITPGQALTEGSLNPHSILRIQGREQCQMYLLSEVQQVYRSQGQNIHDKHFEVIIRKMMSKVIITSPGDTEMLPGDYINRLDMIEINRELLEEGKKPAQFMEELLGITKASLNTESFLSAASFQHTIKVLAGAAIAGAEDPLHGLKENVILGKLIPAGTGYESHQAYLADVAAAEALAEAAEAAGKLEEGEEAAAEVEADAADAEVPEPSGD